MIPTHIHSSGGSPLSLRRVKDGLTPLAYYHDPDIQVLDAIAVRPKGRYIAAIGHKTVRVWDVGSATVLRSPTDVSLYGLRALAFSADSTHLAYPAEDSSLSWWSMETGRTEECRVPLVHGGTYALWAHSPQGLTFIVPHAGKPQFRHMRNGEEPLEFLDLPLSRRVRPVFSADGRHLAVLDADEHTVRVFTVQLDES